MLLARLILLLTVVPLVELIILLRIAERFSWGPTMALVIATGVVGAYLVKRAGLKTLQRIHTDLAEGVMPSDAILEGVLIFLAGAVLVTPGILTDVFGFALLVGPVRRKVRRAIAERFRTRIITIHGEEHVDTPQPFVDVVATGVNESDAADESHE